MACKADGCQVIIQKPSDREPQWVTCLESAIPPALKRDLL